MEKKLVAFTIADSENMKYADMMTKSLRKFHTAEELPLVVIGPEELKTRLIDPFFFYRATPIIASELFDKGYETVIKIDSDSIICGDISASWTNKSVDASVVLNSNPREWKNFQYTIWDIPPFQYLNCGFVSMRNKAMVEHWRTLCMGPHFVPYQMKEQDLLNIICQYGDYLVNLLDSSNGLWGLSGKGYFQDMVVRKNKLWLDPQPDGYPRATCQVKIIHFAGGNEPNKCNYKIRFRPEVVKFIDKLVK